MKRNKKKILFGVILILLLSVFAEIFLFNFNYFLVGNKSQDLLEVSTENLERVENGHYLIKDEDAYILLNNINQFVGKLEFNTDTFNKNIDIEIIYNDKVKTENINNINKKSIYINESVDFIKISFVDEKGQEILIDDFKIVNRFEFNYIRFFMMLMFFILLSVIGVMIKKKGNIRLEMVFLVLIITFGFLYTIMTPIFYSWDEEEHFVKAYNLANYNLIMREGETIPYPRSIEDFLNKKHYTQQPGYRSFEEYKEMTEKLLEINYINTDVEYHTSTAITYTLVPYIFSSLGILLGKIMNLSFLFSFYLGRFFNVLIYALLGFLSIKLIPTGKKLIFVCMLLPTVVFQAASYSADVIINGFSFFVFAIVIKWIFEKRRLANWDIALICLCFILITASKVTYAPIFLLVLLLKNKNFNNKKKEWLIKIGVILLGVTIAAAIFSYGNSMGIDQWTIPGVNVKEQLKSIIYNPIHFIGIIIKTLLLNQEILFGGATISLAYIGYLGRDLLIIVAFFLCLIALIDTERYVPAFGMIDRGIIILMSTAVIGLSMLALYLTFTPLNSGQVIGFQGRYLSPLIFPLLFIFQRRKAGLLIKPEIVSMIAVVFSTCVLLNSILYVYQLYYT